MSNTNSSNTNSIESIINGIAKGDESSIAIAGFIGLTFFLVSSVLIYKIWKKDGSLLKKLSWTLIVTIPLFGWLLYGALYRIPKPHAGVDKCGVNTSAFYGGAGAP